MNVIEALGAVGADVDATLKRFCQNEALLKRFVSKFPDDGTYGLLMCAVDDGDYEAMERQAHTLKGVAGNLGFTELHGACDALVRCLRDGNREKADALVRDVQAAYAAVLTAIAAID